jgi:hypothetical protein
MAQISKRQIQDGSIDNNKIQPGAAIETSKLAEGADFIKRDGSVAATSNMSMGGNKITGLATATNNDEAVNLGQLNSALSNLNNLFDSKGSCKASTTGNITISNPATSTFDGITLSNGDRLFVGQQTAQAENGLYTFNGSGSALTRTTDMDSWAEVPGAFVAIEQGTLYQDTIWLCTSNQNGTLGTTAIVWQQIPTTAGLSNSSAASRQDISIYILYHQVNIMNMHYTQIQTQLTKQTLGGFSPPSKRWVPV